MGKKRLILLFLLLMSIAMNECKAWKPQPYKIYLIDIQCQQDSVIPSSVMAFGTHPMKKVDTTPFRCGPYWVAPPLPVTEQIWGQYEWYDHDESLGGLILETITDGIIGAFFN